jgi:hypothetical protein
MRHEAIRIHTEESDYSDIPEIEHEWSRSDYGEFNEFFPTDYPDPLGNHVTTTH